MANKVLTQKEFYIGRYRQPMDNRKHGTITLKVDEIFPVPERPVHGKGLLT
jgi:hypothetical protein